MALLGNDCVNSIYEFEVPSYVKKPTAATPPLVYMYMYCNAVFYTCVQVDLRERTTLG